MVASVCLVPPLWDALSNVLASRPPRFVSTDVPMFWQHAALAMWLTVASSFWSSFHEAQLDAVECQCSQVQWIADRYFYPFHVERHLSRGFDFCQQWPERQFCKTLELHCNNQRVLLILREKKCLLLIRSDSLQQNDHSTSHLAGVRALEGSWSWFLTPRRTAVQRCYLSFQFEATQSC